MVGTHLAEPDGGGRREFSPPRGELGWERFCGMLGRLTATGGFGKAGRIDGRRQQA